jgi:hypothetical protein
MERLQGKGKRDAFVTHTQPASLCCFAAGIPARNAGWGVVYSCCLVGAIQKLDTSRIRRLKYGVWFPHTVFK